MRWGELRVAEGWGRRWWGWTLRRIKASSVLNELEARDYRMYAQKTHMDGGVSVRPSMRAEIVRRSSFCKLQINYSTTTPPESSQLRTRVIYSGTSTKLYDILTLGVPME